MIPKDGSLLKLDVAFRYVGNEPDVPAPVIRVRDANGHESLTNGSSRGGRRDRECVVWLSVSPLLALGLRNITLPRQKVEVCQRLLLTYYFGLPGSARRPFDLLFADSEPVRVPLKQVGENP